jgi:uncharacterized protein (DUF2141 family)
MRKNFSILIICFAIFFQAEAQSIKIHISGIRNKTGSLQLMFFKCQKQFEDDKPFLIKRFSKNNVQNGEFKTEININPGIYGIVLLDDENDSENMEYKYIKIPKEGFGFSNYVHSGLFRPTFNDFCFELKNETVQIEIKTKYM